MGRSMGVSTDNSHTWKRKPLLWTNHVDNAIILSVHGEMREPEVRGILAEGVHLFLAHGVLYGFILVMSGRIVVGHAEYLPWTETLQPPRPHASKGLRRRHLMTIEAVYVKLGGAIWHNLHYVLIPNLVK